MKNLFAKTDNSIFCIRILNTQGLQSLCHLDYTPFTSLKMNAGLTRFPLSTMADNEGTQCDIELFSRRVNTADSIEATSITSGKNY
jgi:hypothetical protein